MIRWHEVAAGLGVAVLVGFGCGNKAAEHKPPPATVTEDAASAPGAADPEHQVLVITGVAVKVVDPATPREIYPQLLAKQAGQILTRSPAILGEREPVPDGATVRRAKMELVIHYGISDEGTDIGCAVTARVVWEQGDDLAASADVLAQRPIKAGDRDNLDGLIAEHVERAVIQAAQVVAAKETLRTASEAEILAAMGGDDQELVAWALTVAAKRGMKSAVDPAIALLASRSRMVVDAAIGALANLHARRAVPSLTALSDPDDAIRTRTLIEALAVIGGDDAEVFLDYVASGHPDPAIRHQAKDALAHIRTPTAQSSP